MANLTLFKALLLIGFEKVAPRTLKRGNVTITVTFVPNVRWIIRLPHVTYELSTQKDVLHKLVHEGIVSRKELEYLASIGLEIAKQEIVQSEEITTGSLIDVRRAFITQVIMPRLESVLRSNGMKCPVCGKRFRSVTEFYNHLNVTEVRSEEHKKILEGIYEEVTGIKP
ncbi:hypothetical protein [Acidianus sp. HS-5]|uniref:hypothetical protein n=1 Tax=Acidianus sp. HS-5 TaxID=2886040 RepID=UPI001F43D292|nr:hypothetical protein [Acidianus sp. HS-5]